MNTLTNDQLQQIATTFGLTFVEDILPVRDGFVNKFTLVWWRCEGGPELTKAESDWANIKNYPSAYQLAKPDVSVTYLD